METNLEQFAAAIIKPQRLDRLIMMLKEALKANSIVLVISGGKSEGAVAVFDKGKPMPEMLPNALRMLAAQVESGELAGQVEPLATEAITATHKLNIWTVYDHPSDFPDKFVARRHEVDQNGVRATEEAFSADSLEELRRELEKRELCSIGRAITDNPKIVECWM